MASVKVHVGKFSDPGTASCDFRGDKFIGKEQGDHHSTVRGLEIDPAPEALIEKVLEKGPKINQHGQDFSQGLLDLGLDLGALFELSSALGGPEGASIRIGVWDE